MFVGDGSGGRTCTYSQDLVAWILLVWGSERGHFLCSLLNHVRWKPHCAISAIGRSGPVGKQGQLLLVRCWFPPILCR